LWLSAVLALGLLACGSPTPDSPETGSAPTPAVQGKDTAYFVHQMTDLARFSRFDPSQRMVLRSSHDPANQAEDTGVFLGDPCVLNNKTWHVMFDEKGPGCITRLWLSSHAEGRLRFEFDNESSPRLDLTVAEFFGGTLKEAAGPLILSVSETGSGNISYLPMPFQSRCTVLTDTTQPDFKYQINALILDPTDEVLTFTPLFDDRTRNTFVEAVTQIHTPAYRRFQNAEKQEKKYTLQPNQPEMLLNFPGPASIDYIEFQFADEPTTEMLNNVAMSLYWDGLEQPSVLCSLIDFFCGNRVQENWNAMPLGYQGEQKKLYSQFYMPFYDKAQLYLENKNDKPITLTFRYHVNLVNVPRDTLYLYARSHQRVFHIGMLYPVLEFEGNGYFAGLNMINLTEPLEPKCFFLEGDEYFYVNGEAEPSWSGTGLDNYFNGDNRLENAPRFQYPLFGCIGRTESAGGGFNCYRFQLLDAIPFKTSLVLAQEAGCPIRFASLPAERPVRGNTKWTCFWYGRPAPGPVTRAENLFYCNPTQDPNGAPDLNSPLIQSQSFQIRLPKGTWWIHVAPIWDITKVQSIKKVVE